MRRPYFSRKLSYISNKLETSSTRSIASLNLNCFSEPEKLLFAKVKEILDKDSSEILSPEVMQENFDLTYKAGEIIMQRVTEVFTFLFPRLTGGEEIGIWFFNQYFYDFLRTYVECIKTVMKRSENEREAFLSYLKKEDKLNSVFKINRNLDPTTFTLMAIDLGGLDKAKTRKRIKMERRNDE